MHATVNRDGNWDLSRYFLAFNGPGMRAFKRNFRKDVEDFTKKASLLDSLGDSNQNEWEEIFLALEGIQARFSHLESYVECISSADADNEKYTEEQAGMSRLKAEYARLEVELDRALKGVPDSVFHTFIARDAFMGNAGAALYYLARMRKRANMTMSKEMEILAADLGVDGIEAWGRLYNNTSGKLTFEMQYPDGRKEIKPFSQRRSLMEKPDREIREAAFRGGNEAWAKIADIPAAALNAISGTRLTLGQKRGTNYFLDTALFDAGIKQETLEAMLEAVYSEIALPKKILGLKAKMMGRENIAWFDLGAPLDIHAHLDWGKAKQLVEKSFFGAYPKLGRFFRNLCNERWIDWEPRTGKRPGGFCSRSLLINESRIFMTYNNTIGDILTLAHESGHAFHENIMRGVRTFGRHYPMTLAESASTFGEMILAEGIMKDPEVSDEEKALMLDAEINHGAIYLLDIPVRYEFEKAVYEERASHELSVARLNDIMVQKQRAIFGDVLEKGGEDPYFWATKLHFYITGVMFYNFPYTFGYLLSRGLFALFKEEGEDFLPKYEKFLMLSGSDTPEAVAKKTIGKDLSSPEFWVNAIHTLKKPIEEMEVLLSRIKNK
ncbi:MAG: M3 family oligoendopeptidase [bacterium]|nr:M3 family oligoendopeptidase [bacterium]